ncbi:MAG: aldo/keto reductase [Ignavibacteriaceae bacterium]
MKYNLLGHSGLFVSEICFGVMTFTGEKGWTHLGKIDQAEANNLVAIALNKGVNFFDAADIYSLGNSEVMLGKALGKKRNDSIVTTKCGFRMKEGPNGDGLSRKRIIEACEASLKRLNTDYIDLYLIHSFDFLTPLEETLGALNMLIHSGKVRYIGCSNFTGSQIVKAMSICEKNNWEKFINLQAYYSLLGRDIELEIVPTCIEQGIGITVWSPLHGGILSGKYQNKNWPPKTRIKKNGGHFPYDLEKSDKILKAIEKISLERKVTISQVALNYLLNKNGITSVIIGARNKKQLVSNIESIDFNLSENEMKILNEISQPNKPYPYWYFDIFRKDRMNNIF